MFPRWLDLLVYGYMAASGLYMLAYDTAVIPQKLTQMMKWRWSIRKVRIAGLFVFIAAILLILETLGLFESA